MSAPQRRESAESRRKYRQARRQHTISNTEPDLQGLSLSHSATSQTSHPSISFQPSPTFNAQQLNQRPVPTTFSESPIEVENYMAAPFGGHFTPAMETIPIQDENWSPFPFQATIDPPEQESPELSYGSGTCGPIPKQTFASIPPPTEQIPAADMKYVRLAHSDSALRSGMGYVIPQPVPYGQETLPPSQSQQQQQQQQQLPDFHPDSYPFRSYSPSNLAPLPNHAYPEGAVLSEPLSHPPGLLSTDPHQYSTNSRHLSPSGQWGNQTTRSGMKREASLPLVLASSPSEPFPNLPQEATTFHGGYMGVSGGDYLSTSMPYCVSPPPTYDNISQDPQAGYSTSRPHALSASAELGIPYSAPGSTGSYPRTLSPASSPGRDDQVRVLNSRPKPQCWDHGCNGRQFSTFSNLLRHQREKSGAAAKSECPHCGIVFTRTTARNGHLAQGKCKGRRGSMD